MGCERLLFSFSSLSLLSFFSVVVAVGCGETEPAPVTCVGRTPPPLATEARILRLDQLNLGDLGPTGVPESSAWKSVGYNVDGLCSTSEERSFACRRLGAATRGSQSDGNDGIDNSFAQNVVPLYRAIYKAPSLDAAGRSYLSLLGGGKAKLHLGTETRATLVIDLEQVHLSEPDANGSVTLAGIAPRDPLLTNVRGWLVASTSEWCGSSSLDMFLTSVGAAADIPISGNAAADTDCDGISFAMTFTGTQVAEVPALLSAASCDADAGAPSDAAAAADADDAG
jgi:hypothetical protein